MLTITEYKTLLEQAQNIASLYRGQKFNYLDSYDKKEDFLAEIDLFKKQGRLN